MRLSVQMQLDCEHCGASRSELVPAQFHYSDGCYTVLAIDEQKCGCDQELQAAEASRRYRAVRAVRDALKDKE